MHVDTPLCLGLVLEQVHDSHAACLGVPVRRLLHPDGQATLAIGRQTMLGDLTASGVEAPHDGWRTRWRCWYFNTITINVSANTHCFPFTSWGGLLRRAL